MTTMEDVVGLKAAADSAFKGKDWMEASECYTAAIDARKAVPDTVADTEVPQLFVLYNNRSASYRNARFASLAAKDAESSLSLESGAKNVRGLQRLGNALRTLGDFTGACDQFKRCIALGDNSVLEVLNEIKQVSSALEQSSKAQIAAVAATTNMKQNEEDPYGSGDQSNCDEVLPGTRQPNPLAMALRRVWAEGADFNPLFEYTTQSDFMYHCYVGNVKAVKFLMDQVKGDDEALRKLVNKRESILRLSPLLGAIGGTRSERPAQCGDGRGNLEVCKLLLLNGADVNAKDFAGFSVVHHAATKYATPLTLEILPMLYARGAKFQTFNRFGDGTLAESVMNGRYEAVKGLLQFGADPTNPHRSSLVNIQHLAMGKPEISQLLNTYQAFRCLSKGDPVLLKPPVKVKIPGSHDSVTADRGVVDNWTCGEYRVGITVPDSEDLVYVNIKCENLLGEKKSDSACAQCGTSGATQQCSVCRVPKYCDAACQKAHWKAGHKKECKKPGVWIIKPPSSDSKVRASLVTGEVVDHQKQLAKIAGKTIEDLMVKVQIPMNSSNGLLMIYDEKRAVNWYVSQKECGSCYSEIVSTIQATGIQKGKQYYRADLVKGDLHIVSTGLGMQAW